ncbi:GLPGLI family protein [Maribacter thermophilus]|uniref:GLPGLI family protein n=1 Tax=Maribacter thermophilus TaxID=1197874 RepID=UPI000A034715|nr:GLPGLI family protein [Maribacter thermophilus]
MIMIKNTTLFIFLVITWFAYSQEGVVEYHSIYYDVATIKKDKDFARKLALEINDMKYVLRYNTKESFFEELPHAPHDEFMAKIASGIAFSDRSWYQDAKKNTAYRNKKIKDSMYIVSFNDRMNGWTLHNETKSIGGYTCYKATQHHVQYYTENEFTIEAWYTPEIPVPYGPSGFGGLPGLILQLERSHIIIVADKVTLNPAKGIKPIEKIKPGRVITTDEKHILMRRARKVTED